MRTPLSLAMAGILAGFVAAPVVAHSDETYIEKHNTYNAEHRVETTAPSVRERTTIESEQPAAPTVQKRTSETMVRKGDSDDADSKTKVEQKTKIEHEDD